MLYLFRLMFDASAVSALCECSGPVQVLMYLLKSPWLRLEMFSVVLKTNHTL